VAYSYSGNKIVEMDYFSTAGKPSQQVYYTYNADGYLAIQTITDGQGNHISNIAYQYNPADNQFAVIPTQINGGDTAYFSKQVYTYSNGKLTRQDFYNSTGDTLLGYATYNNYSGGNCTLIMTYRYGSNQSVNLTEVDTLQYDDRPLAPQLPTNLPASSQANNIKYYSQTNYYNGAPTVTTQTQYTYQYNSGGYPTLVVKQSSDGHVQQTVYTYNCQ
jgi:hypothetical protein